VLLALAAVFVVVSLWREFRPGRMAEVTA
jgi:hypothetical protein